MSSHAQVLLVEDDDDIREALVDFLEAHGFGVCSVASAEEGLSRLKRDPVSLLITDFALLGESGVWLVQEGRRQGLLDQTGVILITALVDLPVIDDALVLPKPLDMEIFLRHAVRFRRPPPQPRVGQTGLSASMNRVSANGGY
jgi:DNA-binding response OmpR family regulator